MSKYKKELLEPIVKESRNWAELCNKLGIKPATGAQSYIKTVVTKFNITYNHFIGKRLQPNNFNQRRDASVHFTTGKAVSSHKLRLKLIRDGYKINKCEICNLDTWNGKPIPTELHHIDGNKLNNLLENLQIVCPNCHAQTNNYTSKNRRIDETR